METGLHTFLSHLSGLLAMRRGRVSPQLLVRPKSIVMLVARPENEVDE